jgi:hypothetical protein
VEGASASGAPEDDREKREQEDDPFRQRRFAGHRTDGASGSDYQLADCGGNEDGDSREKHRTTR